MDALERGRDVERARGGHPGSILAMELHSVGDVLNGRVLARQLDGDFIRIEAVHRDLRIRLRDRDRGPAGAAADVDRASRRIRQQSLVNRRDAREPIVRQGGEEDRPVAEPLTLNAVPTVRLVGDAPTGSEGLDHVLEGVRDAVQLPDRGAQVGKGIAVEQDLGVTGGEREGVLLPDIGPEDARGRLLLEPLLRVPLRGAGPRGQLPRCHRALREDLVETEALAEADRQQVEVPEGGLEQLLGEGVPLVSIALHGDQEPIDCAPARPRPQVVTLTS